MSILFTKLSKLFEKLRIIFKDTTISYVQLRIDKVRYCSRQVLFKTNPRLNTEFYELLTYFVFYHELHFRQLRP